MTLQKNHAFPWYKFLLSIAFCFLNVVFPVTCLRPCLDSELSQLETDVEQQFYNLQRRPRICQQATIRSHLKGHDFTHPTVKTSIESTPHCLLVNIGFKTRFTFFDIAQRLCVYCNFNTPVALFENAILSSHRSHNTLFTRHLGLYIQPCSLLNFAFPLVSNTTTRT